MSGAMRPPVDTYPSGQTSPPRNSSPSTDHYIEKSSSNGSTTPPSSSTGLPSLYSPIPRPTRYHSHNDPTQYIPRSQSRASSHTTMSRTQSLIEESQVPPCLLSPAYTPPTSAPGTPSLLGVSTAGQTHTNPNLMQDLPEVNCVVRARIPTTTGTEIFLHLYQNNIDNKEHLAIVFGDRIRSTSLDAPREGETEMDRMIRGAYTGRLFPGRTTSIVNPNSHSPNGDQSDLPSEISDAQKRLSAPLVRIHSECYTGETAWSARCDCGEQLDEAARLMAMDPAGGVIVYLRQEGRGIGLGEKLKAYNLQDLGNDTVQANLILRHPADARSYGLATSILADLNCTEIRLLTNNPDKIAAVEGPGKEIRVVSRVSMVPKMWRGVKGGVEGKEVSEYLRTKITKMGHMLDGPMPNFSHY